MGKFESSMNTQIKLFYSIFTLIFGLLHLWVVYVITDGFTLNSTYTLILSLIFLAGIILIPVGYRVSHKVPKSKYYFLTWIGYIWMGLLFISIWISTAYFFVKLFWPEIPVNGYQLLGFIAVVCGWSLYMGMKDPVVRLQRISAGQDIGKLRIVHITDLHVGLLGHNKAWLERIVQKINTLNADFVVLTGDLVEGKWTHVFPLIQPLKDVKSRMGKIFVSGNHEFIHGGMLWERAMKEMGWTILHNENKVFNFEGKKILLAGVPDRMVSRFESSLESQPDKALKTDQLVDCKILLAHEPASVWDLKTEIPDLILSGHTHGGQIFPFGGFVRLVQPLVVGWKTIKGVRVYAHPGTGLWGPPMRLGSESQIVLLELSSLSSS